MFQDLSRDDKSKRRAINLLISEKELLQWRMQGLPIDTTSLVGAACALRSPMTPYIIDPTGLAVSWLISNLGKQLEKVHSNDGNLATTLESAVRFGQPLLIQVTSEIPKIVLPLLRKKALKLGDRVVQAQRGFRLFLSTRKQTLDHIPSQVYAVIAVIALGSDASSVTERLIGKVWSIFFLSSILVVALKCLETCLCNLQAILQDFPQMDEVRKEALNKKQELLVERDEARFQLLKRLGASSSSSNLIQEPEDAKNGVIASLEAVRLKAREISAALEQSRKDLEEQEVKFREYEASARFAARLFDIINSLHAISSAYIFSIEEFTDVYLSSLSDKSATYSDDRGTLEKR